MCLISLPVNSVTSSVVDSILASIPALSCKDSAYSEAQGYFYFLIAVLIIVPLVMLIWLYKNRKHLRDERDELHKRCGPL